MRHGGTPCAYLLEGMNTPTRPDWTLEAAWWQKGYARIAGVDEAGRGAWAGPVVACAIVLSPGAADRMTWLVQLNDSKRCTPALREWLRTHILQSADAVGIGCVGVCEIDRMGIGEASRRAMLLALRSLPLRPDAVLIDYISLRTLDIPQQAVTHGDARSYSIAAASIIAKTTRDAMLRTLDVTYPAYGFAQHKGYGTTAHRVALARYGPCDLHRRSFRPVHSPRLSDSLEEWP